MIRTAPILLIAAASLFAGDEVQLALSLRAQADYDRVRLSAPQRLEDAERCVQSQAALLPVASPAESAAARYRKGYCLLAGALVTRAPAAFLDAARALEAASPQLAAIARMEAGMDGPEVVAALDRRDCGAGGPQWCAEIAAIATHWKGWLAARQGRMDEAGRDFDGQPEAWAAWVEGRVAFASARYNDAAAAFTRAADAWKAAESAPVQSIPRGLEPPGDLVRAWRDLGAAQLAGGDARAAIVVLDAVIRRRPTDARSIALRGRAHELAGQAEAAISDYNLASRAAFAEAGEGPSGDAHLYRGMWLFRRRQYAGAEDEFTRALNQSVDASVRPDALAWRYLAAVEQHGCGASRRNLEEALAAASPFFPREEARIAASVCRP